MNVQEQRRILRVLMAADYMIETGATVRETAKKIGSKKTTVHKDVTYWLWFIDPSKAREVRQVLDKNKEEIHVEVRR